MKKALVLLLALTLVSAAFAAPDADLAPTIEGNAVLEWGVTLTSDPANLATTGFNNTTSATLKMPLVKKGTVTKGEGDVYGFIEIKDFEWATPNAAPANGTVSAKIVFGPAYLVVASQAAIGEGFIAALKDGDVKVDAGSDTFGTILGYSANGLTLKAEIGSKTTYTSGNNEYALGAFAEYVVGPAKIQADFGMDVNDNTAPYGKDPIGFGLSVPVSLAVLKGLNITPSFDASFDSDAVAPIDTFTWDAGAVIELVLSDKNSDDAATNFKVTGYYSGVDEDAEVSAAFTEVEGGGMVPNLGAGLTFTVWDLIDSALAANDGGYKFDANASYKVVINDQNNVQATVTFMTTDALYDDGTDADADTTLVLQVVFTNTSIAQTTITADYKTGDLLVVSPAKVDLGRFILGAKIAY